MRVLEGVPDISFIHFSDADVVRHKLVQRIVNAYLQHAEQNGPDGRSDDRGGDREPQRLAGGPAGRGRRLRSALAAEGVDSGQVGRSSWTSGASQS